ncbi:hypothetical protein N7495_004170 [Penicillium taxi]|uniref:uncharacterized protein n=1 Tax=Penicillium taxi TaxID=168475 RepID=UPI002544DFEA|nr:uncharacterized protein N7495_004170 [Penicillium taxi]KAJ5899426.1 hypothetical protein N7495_004170 [Penicillium taxi]
MTTGILFLGLTALVYFKPEYTIYNSRVATIAILLTVHTLWKIIYQLDLYPRFFTPLKHIQTPSRRRWLTGNTESLFNETPHQKIRQWVKSCPNEGLFRYYMVGNLERVVLTSPNALREVLVEKAYDFAKPELVRTSMRRIVGDGILIAEGDDHKKQRKDLMPAFSYRHIKDLYPIFWSKSSEMVKLIKEDLADRQSSNTIDNVVQVNNWSSRATLDIIGLAGMGQDFDSLQNPNNRLNQSYRQIITSASFTDKLIFMIGLVLSIPGLVFKLPLKRNIQIKKGGEFIRETARQMIRKKKANMDSKDDTGVDIMSIAIQNGSFEEENLVAQLMTLLAAGHETTSNALQWSVYALCKNPKVQSRLRVEIRSNLPPISLENPEPIAAATIDSLPYLNAVCNEVLRFYPSVPNSIRVALKDTTLVGKFIPKDTAFIISMDLMNHMEELWGPDADEFNPDRFMGPGKANTGGATNNYAFMSFLHGPRSCIGQSFAKAELACLLAAVVGSFELELKDPHAPLLLREGGATVSPRDGVLAKFTKLDGW